VRRIAVPLLGLGMLLAVGVGFAQPASAHAMVVGSQPTNGADLKDAPATVEISYDKPVGIAGIGYLHVVDAAGHRVDRGAPVHPDGDATKVQVGLVPGLRSGQYIESYRVISADSHPITGAISFDVGPVSAGELVAPVAAPQVTNPATGAAFDVARWISFAGLVLLFGGWLAGTVWPAGRTDRRARALAVGGAWAPTIGAVFELLV
jgi:copper transport protein